ncbi:MAG: hypothetical protein WDW38_006703 [Sanguina aurantia]
MMCAWRRDGWTLPLVQALTLLREVAVRLRLAQEAVCYSLELTVLPGVMTQAAALTLCRSSVGSLLSGISEIKGGIIKTGLATRSAEISSAEAALTPTLSPQPSSSTLPNLATQPHAGGGSPAAGPNPGQPSPSAAPLCSPTASALTTPATSPAYASATKQFHYTIDPPPTPSLPPRTAAATTPLPAASSSPSASSATAAAAAAAAAAATASNARSSLDLTLLALGGSGGGGGGGSVSDILQRHSQQDFGWWRCVAVAGGYSPAPADAPSLSFHLAFCNQLCVDLPLRGVLVTFSDDLGEFSMYASPATPSPSTSPTPPHSQPAAASSTGGSKSNGASSHPTPSHQLPGSSGGSAGSGSSRASASHLNTAQRSTGHPHLQDDPPPGASLTLTPSRWQGCALALSPRTLGALRAERATLLLLGEHTTLTFKLQSFPAGTPTLGSLHLQVPSLAHPADVASRGPFHSVPGGVGLGVWTAHVTHVGSLPALSIPPPTQGPALVQLPVEGMDNSQVSGVLEMDGDEYPFGPDAVLRVPVPACAPRSTLRLKLWLRATQSGKLRLSLAVACPSKVTAQLEVAVEDPWEHECRVSSEAGVHSLTLPRINSRELGTVSLTIGQPVMMTALLRALQQGPLQLLGVEVETEASSGLTPVSDVRQQQTQLAPSACVMRRGDVHTVLLPICPTKMWDVGIPVGRLKVTWKRAGIVSKHKAHGPRTHTDPRSNGLLGDTGDAVSDADLDGEEGEEGKSGGGGGSSSGGGRGGKSSRQAAEAGRQKGGEVTTYLDLPVVTVQDSILTARALGPSQVTTGISFMYSLQVQNFTPHLQELQVAVQDSPTFLCGNDRNPPSHSLGPNESHTFMWMMVATVAGYAQLPTIRVLALRNNCTLVSQGLHVLVAPF